MCAGSLLQGHWALGEICRWWVWAEPKEAFFQFHTVTPWNSSTQAVSTMIQKVVRFTELLRLSVEDYKARNSVLESHWSSDLLDLRKSAWKNHFMFALGLHSPSSVPDGPLLARGHKTNNCLVQSSIGCLRWSSAKVSVKTLLRCKHALICL